MVAVSQTRIGTTVLGCFRLESELGEGSFATAYLASQTGTDRLAVVKIAHPHLVLGKHSKIIRRRAELEMRAASRVHHPNLVTVYLAGETSEGLPAIAMEFVPGNSLESVLETKGQLPVPTLESLGVQIASALAAIHEAGIVHRDLTPANVMATTTADGTNFKLLDFGVAKVVGSASDTQGAIGTPRYMAPEQAHNEPVPASDMFSIGAILWWATTGREFMEGRDSAFGVLSAIARLDEAPDPRSVAPNLAPAIAAAVRALLQPDPTMRPSARSFVSQWKVACQQAAAPKTTAPFGRVRTSSAPPLDLQALPQRRARILLVDTHTARAEMVIAELNRRQIPWEHVATSADAWVRLRHLHADYSLCLLGVDDEDSAHDTVNGLIKGGCTTPCVFVDYGTGRPIDWSKSPAKGYALLPGGKTELGEVAEGFRDEKLRGPGVVSLSADETAPDAAIAPPLLSKQTSQERPTARRTYTGGGMGDDEQAMTEFVGTVPELLADLRTLIEHGDKTGLEEICRAIEACASAIGADRLAKLGHTTREMASIVDVGSLSGHVDQMELAFSAAFKAALTQETSKKEHTA